MKTITTGQLIRLEIMQSEHGHKIPLDVPVLTHVLQAWFVPYFKSGPQTTVQLWTNSKTMSEKLQLDGADVGEVLPFKRLCQFWAVSDQIIVDVNGVGGFPGGDLWMLVG